MFASEYVLVRELVHVGMIKWMSLWVGATATVSMAFDSTWKWLLLEMGGFGSPCCSLLLYIIITSPIIICWINTHHQEERLYTSQKRITCTRRVNMRHQRKHCAESHRDTCRRRRITKGDVLGDRRPTTALPLGSLTMPCKAKLVQPGGRPSTTSLMFLNGRWLRNVSECT